MSVLSRASANLAKSAHSCEFIFMLPKFAEPALSCSLQTRRVSSPVRVDFYASQVRGACSLLLLATSSGLLTRLLSRPSLLSYFASSPSLLGRASCNLTGFARPCEFSRASCNLAGTSHSREFTLLLRKFAEPVRLCFLQPCRICSDVQVYFQAWQARRAWSLVLLATSLGLLSRASLLSYFARSPSLLARASCKLAGSAYPGEFALILRQFAEPTRSCFLQPCQVCSALRVYFHTSQVRRACLLVLLVTKPVRRACSLLLLATSLGLLTRESILSGFRSSPSLLARASCDLAGSAQPCKFTLMFRKFAELASSCFLQPCGAAHPCEFTLMLRKFADASRWCFLEPCRVCSPVLVYYHASQVRRAFSLVLLATLPGLPTHPSLFSFHPSSPSLLARSSFNLAWTVQPCEFTLMLPKFAEPARSCFLQPHRMCSPMRVYVHFSQLPGAGSFLLLATSPGLHNLYRACSLLLLATSPGMLTCESILLGFASSPSLLTRASCNLADSAQPCEFTFMFRKFAELASSCFLQPCRVAHPCEFTLMLCKFADASLWCFLEPCRVCSPMRVYYHASQVRRAFSPCFLQPRSDYSTVRIHFRASQVRRAGSLVLFATLPGLLTRVSLL
ncbi:hypothetical protein CRG98_004285 [Punica granatum]|uniref:Uncharacterized protein n=1 Tax=Punica granatum TaxID=22663 RepID=A0A2I0L3P3_PUNGR|nr:hypothetical protein CRG98_004285 [Punica granatum]